MIVTVSCGESSIANVAYVKMDMHVHGVSELGNDEALKAYWSNMSFCGTNA